MTNLGHFLLFSLLCLLFFLAKFAICTSLILPAECCLSVIIIRATWCTQNTMESFQSFQSYMHACTCTLLMNHITRIISMKQSSKCACEWLAHIHKFKISQKAGNNPQWDVDVCSSYFSELEPRMTPASDHKRKWAFTSAPVESLLLSWSRGTDEGGGGLLFGPQKPCQVLLLLCVCVCIEVFKCARVCTCMMVRSIVPERCTHIQTSAVNLSSGPVLSLIKSSGLLLVYGCLLCSYS